MIYTYIDARVAKCNYCFFFLMSILMNLIGLIPTEELALTTNNVFDIQRTVHRDVFL